jgi:hypothetical protein
MSQELDEICPPYYAEDRIDLSLSSTARIRARDRVAISVSYTRTATEGLVLPLEMIVQGPSEQSYLRRIYRRIRPQMLLLTPKEGGPHLVVLREYGHNKWWGSISFEVDGQLLEVPRPM